ncbi:heme exporter protein CcmB [Catenovulum sp. SM1970]|uniref:heme exporter protein CcmB n=1 Tax=Marinifaba aquimaris TaxID=2741323 RepID=UPI001573C394|nr:heme exporter protein CcmB [Marinifaba aquimaris]NTS76366.1 heme exporter protein CcmB [Marinifaba aquimaris]
MSYFSFFRQFLQRDFQIAVNQKHELGLPLVFFALILILFPLSVGPEPGTLSKIAPAVGWVAVILSFLLALPRMFSEDFENGWLEQVFLSGYPNVLSVFARIVSFWCLYGIPLVIVTWLLVPFFQFPLDLWWVLAKTLICGSLLLASLGSIASALLLSSRKGSSVLSLLVLPFLIPALIFAAACIDAASQSLPYNAPFMMLSGITIITLTLAPFATAQALKLNLS